MRLVDARAWRSRLRAKGVEATVPLGYSPDKYFVKIHAPTAGYEVRLKTPEQCQTMLDEARLRWRANSADA